MPENPGLPKIQFTNDEWNRTPEPVRQFVLELTNAAEGLLGQLRGVLPSLPPPPVVPPASPDRVTPGQVVLVSDRPLSREAKIAWGLKRAGWDVVLLCGQAPAFDANAVGSTVAMYRGAKEAVALARGFAPVAYHVFSCWSYDVAAALIRNGVGPVIHDNYDVMAGLVREELLMRNHPGQIQLEQYCLENAHGHCCRSLESQAAKHRLGYRMSSPRILVTDMCWGTGAPPVRKLSADDGALHVVYCGNLFKGPPDVPAPNNLHYIVAAKLSARGVHYHIYPSSDELAGIYRAHLPGYLARHGDARFVHGHDPVPSDLLIPELARCDVGLQILSRDVDMSPADPTYHLDKAVYAAANKVFDYADAGIPVIIHRGTFQRSIARRYKLGAAVRTIDEIADARPAAVHVPAALTVDANIARLTRFYRAIAASSLRAAA